MTRLGGKRFLFYAKYQYYTESVLSAVPLPTSEAWRSYSSQLCNIGVGFDIKIEILELKAKFFWPRPRPEMFGVDCEHLTFFNIIPPSL